MKKLIVGISMITFVLFVYTANATTFKQDKPKVVTVTGKTTTDVASKCCAGDKKADAKCCAGDKKTATKGTTATTKTASATTKDGSKKAVQCGAKSDCSKTCGGAKK